MTTTSPANTFQVGSTYTARCAGDHTMTFSWTVTVRTAKFITLVEGNDSDRPGKPKRVGVKTDNGCEWAMPDGAYSMAPVIRASNHTEAARTNNSEAGR